MIPIRCLGLNLRHGVWKIAEMGLHMRQVFAGLMRSERRERLLRLDVCDLNRSPCHQYLERMRTGNSILNFKACIIVLLRTLNRTMASTFLGAAHSSLQGYRSALRPSSSMYAFEVLVTMPPSKHLDRDVSKFFEVFADPELTGWRSVRANHVSCFRMPR